MAELTFLFTQSVGQRALGHSWGNENPWINTPLRTYLNGEFLNGFSSSTRSNLVQIKNVTALYSRTTVTPFVRQKVETEDTCFILSSFGGVRMSASDDSSGHNGYFIPPNGVDQLWVGPDRNEDYLIATTALYNTTGRLASLVPNSWLRDTTNVGGAPHVGTDGRAGMVLNSYDDLKDTYPLFCM